jgi:signal transduction histidine kinase
VIMPLARGKQIRVHVPASCAVEAVTQDQQKFKQILFNLLSNAVKFTDPGGTVFVGLERVDDGKLLLTVRDTGIGIAKEDMLNLFEAFRQLDGGLSRRYEGTGLGLTLTRKLVELQGGRIDVKSEQGVGSTFFVLLPVTVDAQAASEPRS